MNFSIGICSIIIFKNHYNANDLQWKNIRIVFTLDNVTYWIMLHIACHKILKFNRSQ